MRFASVTSSAAVSSLCLPTSARNSWRLSAAPVTSSGSMTSPSAASLSVALLGGGLRAELDAHGLELAREGLDVVVGEVVLERERLELGRLDVAALLRRLQQRATLLGLDQFDAVGSASNAPVSFPISLPFKFQTFSL